ncbi:MAG: TonB-dependent receptor [Acidobacteriia bacterium]|nr:TonB-dependent receptor [Terriglobia bacterium]
MGGTGTLRGIVRDATGAPVPSAIVELSNPVTSFSRQAKTGSEGAFAISGIPPNNYRLLVSLAGFQSITKNVVIQTAIPMDLEVRLEVAGQQTTVTVEATTDNLVENRATVSDVVDRQLLAALPTSSPDSGLNDAIIYTTPGVAADSNGFFHPLGDHAQVSYVIDGQPVSDQRNKVFSTSIPANAIQSMEVISGSPPAEYGDKTSLVINASTRSGLGQKPTGSVTASYGSFGTIGEEATLGLGGPRWGNFLVVNAERTGRFLDTPEFWPMHDIGNTGTFFDRVDFEPGGKDALHLDLMAARNWLQIPNTYDQPQQDQRQKVVSFNVAPGYQHTIDSKTLVSINAFVRRDQVSYYASRNPLEDSPATLAQDRSLTNFGAHVDLTHVQGRHNWKAGLNAMQTRLDEAFSLGITDPTYNAPYLTDGQPNPKFLSSLLPYDLTRGGQLYQFRGKANINQFAAFLQDSITLGDLTLNLGLRFDRYDGLTRGDGLQPRGAFSYLFKPTKTVIRGGYSHTIETPTNENLVASSSTGSGGLASNLFKGTAEQRPIALGSRNQYDAGIQQGLGRWVLVDVSYFRKYTRNAFDFDALFSTPITFPIGWKQSKLDGISARVSTIDIHGLRVYATMGHANARFFGPENGGIVFNSNLTIGAYRQDHDQVYQQNVNLHYQTKNGWWTDFTWRYDSGLVVGAVNNLADALTLTAGQQSAIGLYCGDERATLAHRITSCNSPSYGAGQINILAPGTENDDHNPPRTKSRHMLNLGVGTDNLFHAERIRTIVRFTVVNLTNKAALYNFLSPFSGTHWVEPRSYQAQLGWAF